MRIRLGLDDSSARSIECSLGAATLALDANFDKMTCSTLISSTICSLTAFRQPFTHAELFFPVGYWALSAHYNDYTYHQNLVSANQLLRYSGKSYAMQLTVSRCCTARPFAQDNAQFAWLP